MWNWRLKIHIWSSTARSKLRPLKTYKNIAKISFATRILMDSPINLKRS